MSKCFPPKRTFLVAAAKSREAVTLARRRKIRTLGKLQRKLLRSPLGFQNRTKMTKYEALEKNVVSSRNLPSLRQSLVRSVTQKVSVCCGFWGWSTELDGRLPWSMAEGEELGSNLLCADERTRK
jgi:hypothetical protein